MGSRAQAATDFIATLRGKKLPQDEAGKDAPEVDLCAVLEL
jgi:hypothetical protein